MPHRCPFWVIIILHSSAIMTNATKRFLLIIIASVLAGKALTEFAPKTDILDLIPSQQTFVQ